MISYGVYLYGAICVACLALIFYAYKVAVDRRDERLKNFKQTHPRKDIK